MPTVSIVGPSGAQIAANALEATAIPASISSSGARFGPDDNRSLETLHALPLEVPAGRQAFMVFSFDANFENAVVIYRADTGIGTLVRHMRQGTFSPLNDSNTPLPTGFYLVTGWHKEGSPDPSRPWVQSIGVFHAQPSGAHVEFLFEDDPQHVVSSAFDFNDAVAIAEIR